LYCDYIYDWVVWWASHVELGVRFLNYMIWLYDEFWSKLMSNISFVMIWNKLDCCNSNFGMFMARICMIGIAENYKFAFSANYVDFLGERLHRLAIPKLESPLTW